MERRRSRVERKDEGHSGKEGQRRVVRKKEQGGKEGWRRVVRKKEQGGKEEWRKVAKR